MLVGCHTAASKALADGPQALLFKELPLFLEDIRIARDAYLKRALELAGQLPGISDAQSAVFFV